MDLADLMQYILSNSMKEQDAKKKTCPFMSRPFGDLNEIDLGKVKCKGSDCMMWQSNEKYINDDQDTICSDAYGDCSLKKVS